MQIHVILFCFV
jgi:hypothetical protein